MQLNQRLSERMRERLQDQGPENLPWAQFVHDHKLYLIQKKATRRTFEKELLIRYRHRPEEFFVRFCSGEPHQAWVWLFINDIRDATEFTELKTQYLMINGSAISELYGLYSATAEAQEAMTDAV